MPLQDFRFARLAVTAILSAANAPKRRCLTTLILPVESGGLSGTDFPRFSQDVVFLGIKRLTYSFEEAHIIVFHCMAETQPS